MMEAAQMNWGAFDLNLLIVAEIATTVQSGSPYRYHAFLNAINAFAACPFET
jgi:hypothetical protein